MRGGRGCAPLSSPGGATFEDLLTDSQAPGEGLPFSSGDAPRLRLTDPGPSAVHFPRRMDTNYSRRLTAECIVTRYDRGDHIRSWKPKRDGKRNKALDTFVYATAALHGLVAMGRR